MGNRFDKGDRVKTVAPILKRHLFPVSHENDETVAIPEGTKGTILWSYWYANSAVMFDGFTLLQVPTDFLSSLRLEKETPKELDEKGFVFTVDGTAYRCAKWGDSAWLFRWTREHLWESVRKLTQMDVWAFTRNLTDKQQELYFDLERKAQEKRSPFLGKRQV